MRKAVAKVGRFADVSAVLVNRHVAVTHNAIAHLLEELTRDELLASEIMPSNAVDVLRADAGDSIFHVTNAALWTLPRLKRGKVRTERCRFPVLGNIPERRGDAGGGFVAREAEVDQ